MKFAYATFVLFLLVAASMTGCSHSTTTEIQYKYDTTHVHDTLGIALVRFVSMMPGQSIFLKHDPNGSIVGATGVTTESKYFPVTPDTAIQYYLYDGASDSLDRLAISAALLPKGSVNTFALFPVFDSTAHSWSVRQDGGDNNDSQKLIRVPTGTAMLRFINGVSFYPSIPQVDVDIDAASNTITSVLFGKMSDYKPISLASGALHNVIVSTSNGKILVNVQQPFDAGAFYTARFLPNPGDTTFQLQIDEE